MGKPKVPKSTITPQIDYFQEQQKANDAKQLSTAEGQDFWDLQRRWVLGGENRLYGTDPNKPTVPAGKDLSRLYGEYMKNVAPMYKLPDYMNPGATPPGPTPPAAPPPAQMPIGAPGQGGMAPRPIPGKPGFGR
jgi:hypothetical protein